MAEDTKVVDTTEQKTDGSQQEVKMIPKSEAEQAFKARDEAKAKAQALEAQLNKIKDDELAKQGDFKTLLEQKEKELSTIKTELESVKPFKEKWTQFELQERETIKKAMGDKWKDTFDTLDISVLKDMLQFVPQGKDGNPHSPANAGSGTVKAYKDMSVDEIVAARLAGKPMQIVSQRN